MATKDISDCQVVAAYLDASNKRAVGLLVWPEQLLQERTGQPAKVCVRAMERACNRGLIEYGCSLRSGWLTDDGERALAKKEGGKDE